jgi:uncharacterized protein involved in exopolysaccharide biosynthesis
VGALIALGSVYVAYSLPAVYESKATILIEQQGIPTDYVQTPVDKYAEELLQTIYQRVVAAPKVAELIETFDLYPDERQILPKDELLQLFRDSASMSPQNVKTVNARTGREAIITFGFQIAFQHHDPIMARDVAQELADMFVSNNAALRAEAAARTTAFLDAEATELQGKIADVAQRIVEFKYQHANNLPEHQEVNLETWERLSTELTDVESELRQARERRTLLDSELAETSRYRPVLNDSGEPVIGGIDRLAEAQQELIRLRGRYSESHPEIISLRREIAALSSSPSDRPILMRDLRSELQGKREELSAARETYSESHPDVVRLQGSVRSLEEQIRVLENEIEISPSTRSAQSNNPVYMQLRTRISTVDAEIEDLSRRRNQLVARKDDLEKRRLESPDVEREYLRLTEEQDLLLAQNRELRDMENEAAMGEALETGQSGEKLTVIEPPSIPENPISPDRVSLSFLGFIVAIAASLGIVSITDAADGKVRGKRDIYALLEMHPIGIIPYVEHGRDKSKRFLMNAFIFVTLIVAVVIVTNTVLS